MLRTKQKGHLLNVLLIDKDFSIKTALPQPCCADTPDSGPADTAAGSKSKRNLLKLANSHRDVTLRCHDEKHLSEWERHLRDAVGQAGSASDFAV